jgi:hypothetical protein
LPPCPQFDLDQSVKAIQSETADHAVVQRRAQLQGTHPALAFGLDPMRG